MVRAEALSAPTFSCRPTAAAAWPPLPASRQAAAMVGRLETIGQFGSNRCAYGDGARHARAAAHSSASPPSGVRPRAQLRSTTAACARAAAALRVLRCRVRADSLRAPPPARRAALISVLLLAAHRRCAQHPAWLLAPVQAASALDRLFGRLRTRFRALVRPRAWAPVRILVYPPATWAPPPKSAHRARSSLHTRRGARGGSAQRRARAAHVLQTPLTRQRF